MVDLIPSKLMYTSCLSNIPNFQAEIDTRKGMGVVLFQIEGTSVRNLVTMMFNKNIP